jgi:cell division protein FtsI/penicillin-binding protein 2
MNPNNGEILAICSYPSFNLNNYKDYNQEIYNRNLPVWKSYEPGSTFKVFSYAAAIEEGKTSQFKSSRNTTTKIKSKFEEDKRLAIANKKELASELLKEADKVLQYVETVDVSALRNWLMADKKLSLICVHNISMLKAS